MSEKEVLYKIKQLLYKMRYTKSKKMKDYYLGDIVTLQELLELNHINADKELDFLFEDLAFDINRFLEDYTMNSINEFINLNDRTDKLANGCLNIFDKAGYVAYDSKNYQKYDTSFMYELLKDFLSKVDNNTLKKFNESLNNGIYITEIDDYIEGACYDLYSDNKQIIAISNGYYKYDKSVSEIGFFVSIVHELGHVVHHSLINESIKNKNYSNAFSEAISIMFEKMYLEYLNDNNINVINELRTKNNEILVNSLLAKAGTIAVNNGTLNCDYSIPDECFKEKLFDKYSYLLNNLYSRYFDESLPYFYGELIATSFLDEFGKDYKNATKELLEVLMKNEYTYTLSLLDEIGLKKVPKGIEKSLKKVQKN